MHKHSHFLSLLSHAPVGHFDSGQSQNLMDTFRSSGKLCYRLHKSDSANFSRNHGSRQTDRQTGEQTDRHESNTLSRWPMNLPTGCWLARVGTVKNIIILYLKSRCCYVYQKSGQQKPV